jgi:N6-L-threonylcarbamoyladenine synthase
MSVKILALETSCDETSAAVVEDGLIIRSNVISSQIEVHQKFGGVVPEVASRKHIELINIVIEDALSAAGLGFDSLDAVAVTHGPGLAGALLVGTVAAKAVSYALNIPLIAVNHMESHIYANFLVEPELSFPLICLTVSGGHTDLIYIEHHGSYKLVGSTRDDAAGEAFDKIARALDLGYPGGPAIENLSRSGDEEAINFPRAYLGEEALDFSFSGLKTAVMNYLRRAGQQGININKADVAASFQKAVVDVLVDKALLAAKKYKARAILLAGGVAANSRLREYLKSKAGKQKQSVVFPPPVLCTDNAAMVGCAAYYKYMRGDFAPLSINVSPGLKLGG